MRTVVYGSRPDGHARIVVELAASRPDLELVGLLDDFPENRSRTIDGLQVIGTGADFEELREAGIEAVLVGFGESRGRASTIERAAAAGFALPTLVHESSVRYASATLGRGVQIFPLAHAGAGASLGDGVLVNTAASVEHDGFIGAGVVILPGARLGGRVRVEREATIGAGAIVLPDVVIGAGAFVGAGAVVLADVAPHARVVGVPARPLPARS
jgi:sugar O-acyltransferase (sialic acid O-acetyltransferase NeuD family)